jgi:hypothetical protein
MTPLWSPSFLGLCAASGLAAYLALTVAFAALRWRARRAPSGSPFGQFDDLNVAQAAGYSLTALALGVSAYAYFGEERARRDVVFRIACESTDGKQRITLTNLTSQTISECTLRMTDISAEVDGQPAAYRDNGGGSGVLCGSTLSSDSSLWDILVDGQQSRFGEVLQGRSPHDVHVTEFNAAVAYKLPTGVVDSKTLGAVKCQNGRVQQ